ncbi:MAG: hypothetical protein BGO77_07165 [Caedibacter sp. 37-49]|nr:MAG: hypothetical protein BGO77_07165 [Caedibacter sp. 37-49]
MLKKTLLIKPFFFLFSILSIFHQAKSSSIYDQYLDLVENEFDRTEGQQNKYLIVTRPINNEYLAYLTNFKDLDEKKLTEGLSKDLKEIKDCPIPTFFFENTEKTTPISMAVSLGKASLVQKFLSVIDDVNSDHCLAWGYRQPYTLAHMALDPQYPLAKAFVSKEDRLAIVDALAQKKADFNLIAKTHDYRNPPLAAGEASGRELREISSFLRARALLHGADPELCGSSFFGVILKYKFSPYKNMEITKVCLKQYLEKISLGEFVSPLPKVLAHLKQAANEAGFDLEERVAQLKTFSLEREKFNARRQEIEVKITNLRSQRTKRAKRKVLHLQNVKQELEQALTKLERTTLRLLRTN